jgi:hypothetical protein
MQRTGRPRRHVVIRASTLAGRSLCLCRMEQRNACDLKRVEYRVSEAEIVAFVRLAFDNG